MIRVIAFVSASPHGACDGARTFVASAQAGEAGGPDGSWRHGAIPHTMARVYEHGDGPAAVQAGPAVNDPVAAQEGSTTSG